MVDKKQQETEDPEEVIESVIGRTELYIQKNGKMLLTILGAVIILVGGYFAYKYLYTAPRQEKASAAMFAPQNLFANNEFQKALDGDGNNEGFLKIISKYGSTPSANLANHYAGQCYLRLGDYKNAIKFFDQYSDVSGLSAEPINAMNTGLKGDAYIQMGDLAKGVELYVKASQLSDNSLSAPYFARKAGQVYQKLGNNAKALEMYKTIKDKYPQSMEAREVDKFIGQVSAM